MDTAFKMRQTASRWNEAAEAWMQRHSYRLDLTILRICRLLVISRRVNRIASNWAWVATGYLVELAMSMGLNREPGEVVRISTFNRRRRMWAATIVELDLQAWVDQGIPLSVRERRIIILYHHRISTMKLSRNPSSSLQYPSPLEFLQTHNFSRL